MQHILGTNSYSFTFKESIFHTFSKEKGRNYNHVRDLFFEMSQLLLQETVYSIQSHLMNHSHRTNCGSFANIIIEHWKKYLKKVELKGYSEILIQILKTSEKGALEYIKWIWITFRDYWSRKEGRKRLGILKD